MTDSDTQPLIDRERLRKQTLERERELHQHPERAKILIRSKINLIHDYLKEARVAQFTFRSDEDPPMGGGDSPRPLQYFVAAVGF